MRQRRFVALRAAILLAALAGAGCYERVVDAKGYGASGTDIHEPNLKEPGKHTRTPIERRPPKRMSPDGH